MKLHEARTIVNTLAQGIDPVTGEVFAPDSPYNHPRVIRALFALHEHARSGRAKLRVDEKRLRNLERGRPENAGLPWSEEDRAAVAAGFRDGKALGELGAALARSRCPSTRSWSGCCRWWRPWPPSWTCLCR